MLITAKLASFKPKITSLSIASILRIKHLTLANTLINKMKPK